MKRVQMKQFSKIMLAAVMILNYAIVKAQVVDPVDKNKLGNGGYDLVAYFSDNAAVRGAAQFTSEYKGVKYRFASAEHLNTFTNCPEKYLPVCDGYCAWGVAEKGRRVPVNP